VTLPILPEPQQNPLTAGMNMWRSGEFSAYGLKDRILGKLIDEAEICNIQDFGDGQIRQTTTARNGFTKLADEFPAFGDAQPTIALAFMKPRCSLKKTEKSTEWSFKFWKTVFDLCVPSVVSDFEKLF
jgi:hypothetical protein